MQFSTIFNSLIFLITLSTLTEAHPIIRVHSKSLVKRQSCRAKFSGSSDSSTASTSSAAPTPTTNKAASASVNDNDDGDDDSSSSKHSSSTKSAGSSKPTDNTGDDSQSSGLSGSVFSLFPLTSSSKSIIHSNAITSKSQAWSVSSVIDNALPLSDDTLKPTTVLKSLKYSYVDAPDGKKSLKITYPKGSSALSGQDGPAGGVSFYAKGPEEVDLTSAKEVTLGYSVMFEDGFDFHQGGKLPGIYGGDSEDGSVSCSGGRHSDGCFSARFMWREEGKGESYTYLPSSSRFPANKKQCTEVDGSHCNEAYGNSIGRGLLHFNPGKRTTITQRVRLNDSGKSNGAIQVWQDGKEIFNLDGVVLRQNGDGRIRGIQMQSFFGGHGPAWASPKTQHTYLGDFSVAITEKL